MATLALVTVTAVWGWTFSVVKEAVARVDVVSFLFWRFLLATAVAGPWWASDMSPRVMRHGALAGLWLAAAYLLQTYGVALTSATNCGLITGMFVIFTPLIQRFVQGRVLRSWQWLTALASFGGMALLTGGEGTLPNWGDLLTLGAALCFAAHVVFLEAVSAEHRPMSLAGWQFVTATGVFALSALATGRVHWPTPEVLPALVVTGVLATTLAFGVQVWAQQYLPAVRVAVILTCESAFAAVFGVWLAGDRLTLLEWLGAGILFSAVLAAELCAHYFRRG